MSSPQKIRSISPPPASSILLWNSIWNSETFCMMQWISSGFTSRSMKAASKPRMYQEASQMLPQPAKMPCASVALIRRMLSGMPV